MPASFVWFHPVNALTGGVLMVYAIHHVIRVFFLQDFQKEIFRATEAITSIGCKRNEVGKSISILIYFLYNKIL